MKTYSVYDAKTNLSKLLKAAQDGEHITIGARGKPMFLLRALHPSSSKKSFYGIWKSKVKYAPDYDKTDTQIAKALKKHFDKA